MKYKCIIVDDEELARRLIKNHLSQLDQFELVASCESAIEASKILQQEEIDLMFLDIEMPVLKGTDFLNNLVNKPQVIFTTAYRDYAVDAFNLNVVDYLLKPITFSRFFKGIEKFLKGQNSESVHIEKETESQTDYIFIREDRKQVKVSFDAIFYIKSIKDYIQIVLEDKSHTTKYSMTSFSELLDSRFIRVHRSYLVNKDKVTAYTNYDIEINGLEIPIGESYKENVKLNF